MTLSISGGHGYNVVRQENIAASAARNHSLTLFLSLFESPLIRLVGLCTFIDTWEGMGLGRFILAFLFQPSDDFLQSSRGDKKKAVSFLGSKDSKISSVVVL